MRIDSHQHFWIASRGDYYWMTPEVPDLCRDYLPVDLKPLLAKHGIDKTVLVQAAPTVAETDFLLGLASQHEFIGGVVGWLHMESDSFAAEFDCYRQKPKLVGIRPMLQDLAQDDYILQPPMMESLKLIEALDFPFDILTYARQLPYVVKALEKVPNLRAVVDHISKPDIKAHKIEPWKSYIREVAGYRNTYCKLSGMITEAGHRNWTLDDLRPYVEHVVECFGTDRVMFGSDWPVCLIAGTYDQVIGALNGLLEPILGERAREGVFGENACRFYRLP